MLLLLLLLLLHEYIHFMHETQTNTNNDAVSERVNMLGDFLGWIINPSNNTDLDRPDRLNRLATSRITSSLLEAIVMLDDGDDDDDVKSERLDCIKYATSVAVVLLGV